jgi:hypothetical protein
MKRKLSLLMFMALALSLFVLSGCGSDEEPEQPDNTNSAITTNQAANSAQPTAGGTTPSANAGAPAAGGAKASGTLRADPNPILTCSSPGSGKTTLSWDVKGAHRIQIRVGTPGGGVLADSAQMQGKAETGTWVTDGATFFLQDASGARPTTLGSVTVKVACK